MTIHSGESRSKPLRILEVVHDFPPNSFAGTELYTLHLSLALQKLGHDVTVLYPVFGPEPTRYAFLHGEYEGLKIVQFNRTPRPGEGVSDYLNPEYDEPFRKFLKEKPFDLVHFQHLLQLSVNWTNIAREAGLRTILKLDDMFFYCEQIHLVNGSGRYCSGPESHQKCADCRVARLSGSPHKPIEVISSELERRKSILSAAFRQMDYVHTPSHFVHTTFRKYGFDNQNFEVVPTGIKPFPVKPHKAINPEQINIAFMGAIAPRKGILDFIGAVEIFETLMARRGIQSRLRFNVFGHHFKDQVYDFLIRKAIQFPSLNYRGKFVPEDRAEIFSGIDILAVTSLGENYPFIIREAHFAGVPVISTTIAGIPEIIKDGVNGLMYPPGDLKKLAIIFFRIQEKPQLINSLAPSGDKPGIIDDEAKKLSGKFKSMFTDNASQKQKAESNCQNLAQLADRREPGENKIATAVSCNEKGEALYKAGKVDEAVSQFLAAIDLEPGFTTAFNNLGVVNCERGDREKAVNYFKGALKAAPNNKSALLNLIDIQDKQNLDIKLLMACCRAYLEKVPDDKEIIDIQAALSENQARGKKSKEQPAQSNISARGALKKVSVIIPVFNKADLTSLCLQYLEKTIRGMNCEVIVVDNGSGDHTPELLKDSSIIARFIRNDVNAGFSKACNQGAEIARGELLLFLNNDTIPLAGWLEPHLQCRLDDPETGVTGAKLMYPDKTIQHAGISFYYTKQPINLYSGYPADAAFLNRKRRYKAVTGACFGISKDLYHQLDGFDEGYQNGLEDVDLCLKVDGQGGKNSYLPDSRLIHFESQSDGCRESMEENKRLFKERWFQGISEDTHYFLNEDGMSHYLNMENGQFCYITGVEFDNLIIPWKKKADRLKAESRPVEALRLYIDAVHKYPYWKEGLQQIILLSQNFNQDSEMEKCTRRLDILLKS